LRSAISRKLPLDAKDRGGTYIAMEVVGPPFLREMVHDHRRAFSALP
jgi:hypothetical protein